MKPPNTTVSAIACSSTIAAAALSQTCDLQPATSESGSYPISLSEPSPTRLEKSRHEEAFDPHRPGAKGYLVGASNVSEKQDTILYLAYGSNLCSRTFLGRRGIKPLAAINAVVPELVMTFQLPGIPYTEPCFANSKYRNNRICATEPIYRTATADDQYSHPPYHNPAWHKGLVGVVYEVTLADYAHIIATEGGGVAYQDVLVDCYALPKGTATVPSNPTTGAFKAHTLYSPIDSPSKPPPEQGGGRFSRPDPDYAQPSLRYLQLIWDGADEHDFPAEYKEYLHRLQPYSITNQKQALGAFIFAMTWVPFIRMLFALTARYSDDKGRSPKWLATLQAAIFSGVWVSYDNMFYDLFGDGERTQEGRRDEEKGG